MASRTSNEGSKLIKRVSLNMPQACTEDLEAICKLRSSNNQTDAINFAVKLCAWIMKAEAAGGGVYVRETAGEEFTKVKVL